MDVNVHDKVWAEIHLGVINRQWTLLLAEICYKGRLSYNMNLVKVQPGHKSTTNGVRLLAHNCTV